MPRPKNALSIEDAGNPYNPLSAADVWEWHKQNAADAWKAAQDPQTWRDAAQQYGQALLAGSIAPGGNSLGIRAFHGTPHNFDRFDLGKIGTGEGAQAYGHGLYFAQNEGVARSYRDKLAPFDLGQALENKIKTVASNPALGFPESIQNAIHRQLHMNAEKKPGGSDGLLSQWQESGAITPEQAGIIKQGFDAAVATPGHMYEVRINADPEHFLHWDKPLSEQSQAVQSMADKVRGGGGLGAKRLGPDATGQDLYRAMNSPFAGKALGYENWSTSGPSEHLAQSGIPGIKYLDGGSRDSGEGTHNYVVFNPETISVLRKYGLAGLMGGGAAAAGSQQGDQ